MKIEVIESISKAQKAIFGNVLEAMKLFVDGLFKKITWLER